MSASEAAPPLRALKRALASFVITALPLALRQSGAAWIGRQPWIPGRHWRAARLVADLAERDPNAYHRFLWSHHLAYAESYEPSLQYGRKRIKPDRRLLFRDIRACLKRDFAARPRIRSVLEVGCSVGHLLRYVETEVFPDAEVLHGIDIDRYAVESGNAWLARVGSKARLMAGDMTALDALVRSDARYDCVLCAGVLMYLREEAAAKVVRAMLRHTRHLLALTGLAHPQFDNRSLARSEVREKDGAYRHNLDAFVRAAGGQVLLRRWHPTAPAGWNPPYFVLCK